MTSLNTYIHHYVCLEAKRKGMCGNIKKEDVDLKNQYFDIRKSKNVNSIRRVPIADKILPFVESWYFLRDCEYLFSTENGEPFKYRNYYDSYFTPMMDDCYLDYTPHWCRHTFISLMKVAGVNGTIIKKIVGHEGAMCLTERIYTHLDMKIMLDAVNKI